MWWKVVESGGTGILTWLGHQMTQFLGEHDVPVDDKGRIFVPAEFRKELPTEANDTLVVVRGFDRCLTAYPQQVWAEVADKLLRLPQTELKVRRLIRSMLSQAAKVKLDRQGRASIPRKLLAKANIDDQMVVIGALDKLEFWNPQDWQQFLDESDPAMEEVAESLEL